MKNGIRYYVRPDEYHTKTRIMATVGPKTLRYDTLRDMVLAGASFFRFNGAHLDKEATEEGQVKYSDARTMVEHIKNLRDELHQVIGIYFDLGGPKIRIQNVLAVDTRPRENPKENCLHPHHKKGDVVWIRLYDHNEAERFDEALTRFMSRPREDEEPSEGPAESPEKRFWKSQKLIREFFGEYAPGRGDYELMFGDEVPSLEEFSEDGIINLKDGWCQLKITNREPKRLRCEVEYRDSKFRFLPHQGANPKLYRFPEVITRKDVEDISEALHMGADIISLSFVCLPSDADRLRQAINGARQAIERPYGQDARKTMTATYRRYLSSEHHIPIFAKIETAFAVNYGASAAYATGLGLPRPDAKIHEPLIEIADRFDGLMVARRSRRRGDEIRSARPPAEDHPHRPFEEQAGHRRHRNAGEHETRQCLDAR